MTDMGWVSMCVGDEVSSVFLGGYYKISFDKIKLQFSCQC